MQSYEELLEENRALKAETGRVRGRDCLLDLTRDLFQDFRGKLLRSTCGAAPDPRRYL